MRAISGRKQLWAVAVVVVPALAWGLFGRGFETQAAQKEKPDLTKATFWGVETCVKCHSGNPENFRVEPQMVRLTEYDTWQTKDRHSLAYLVLEGKRGQEIGRLLKIDVTTSPMCLSCHATTFLAHRGGKKFSVREGVSCDGCHGPAEHWISEHALKSEEWRVMTPEQKEELGMRDLRNPMKRAEMCISCHVGNAAEGKLVTHSMYAAGHPPLPSFEVATFSANMPPHWMDMKDVPFFQKKATAAVKKAYHFDTANFEHTKLVMAGGTANVRAAARLLAERAGMNADALKADWKAPSSWPPPWILPQIQDKAEQRWPEYLIGRGFKDLELPEALDGRWPEIVMTHADCYACHHELQSESWRQKRHYTGKLGRPQLPGWTAALVQLGIPGGPDAADCKARITDLQARFTEKPFGKHTDVAKGAVDVGNSTAGLRNPEAVDRALALGFLKTLTARPAKANDYPDFDTAREIASALRAIYNDGWNKGGPNREKIEAAFAALDEELNLTLDSKARQQFVQERSKLMKEKLTDGGKLKKFDNVSGILAKDKKLGTELQRISDAELSAALEVLGRYDPLQFRRRLEELSQLLK